MIALFNRFEKFIKEEELFRDPDVTLAEIANRLEEDVEEVRQAIISCTAMEFHDYLEELRVHVVLEEIRKSESFTDLRVIAMECGFLSLQSLRSSFEKIVEISPDFYCEVYTKNRLAIGCV